MNSPTPRPAVVSIILRGGLIAGTLDALDAVIAYGFLGMNPVQVLQYVASGLLGTAAFAGNTVIGFANAGLGAVLHYFIALVVAATYYTGSRKIPALNQKPVLFGLLYGTSVFLFMNYLVLPLSAVARSPSRGASFLTASSATRFSLAGRSRCWLRARGGERNTIS